MLCGSRRTHRTTAINRAYGGRHPITKQLKSGQQISSLSDGNHNKRMRNILCGDTRVSCYVLVSASVRVKIWPKYEVLKYFSVIDRLYLKTFLSL